MVEFKVQVEESVVQSVGYNKIDKQLNDFMRKIILKIAAQDILDDLKSFDLENDAEWKISRNLAWEQEKHKYVA